MTAASVLRKVRCLGFHDWRTTPPWSLSHYTMKCRRCGAGLC